MAEFIYVFVHGVIGSGRSTFISAIDELNLKPSNHNDKSMREDIVDIDFGRVTIEEQKYLLYLFAYVGEQLVPRVENHFIEVVHQLVYPLIVNSTKNLEGEGNSYQTTKALVKEIRERNKPFLIASSKRKDAESYSIAELRDLLELPENIPLLECDPVSDPASAMRVLVELFRMLPQDDLILAAIEKLSENKENNS
jgi:uncharacterized protein